MHSSKSCVLLQSARQIDAENPLQAGLLDESHQISPGEKCKSQETLFFQQCALYQYIDQQRIVFVFSVASVR